MHITGIGIDAKAGPLLEDIAAELRYYQECGFDIVELSIHDMDVVLNGRPHRANHEAVCALTREFDFSYTVHAPDRLNLAINYDPALERDVFAASLEFCADVGAQIMVYHSGLSVFNWLLLQGPGTKLPGPDIIAQAREAEVKALQALLPLAAEHNITVAMENMVQHGYEATILRAAGLAVTDLPTYYPALVPAELVTQLKAVNHPNLGLTLDFAHLYIAANQCKFDYLQSIREAAPYVRHLHIDDNFGRPQSIFEGLRERNTHGEGDVHLPPGWGDIPLDDAYALLSDYSGPAVLELRDRYRPYYIEARKTLEPYRHQ